MLSRNWMLETLGNVMNILYGFLICGTIVAIIIVTVQRFTRNLLGDEGYLMFTIPVGSWQLLLSKMIVMAVWIFFSLFFIMLSAFIISGEGVFYLFGELFTSFGKFVNQIGGTGTFLLLFWCLVVLLCCALPIYASIMVGGLWRKHRTLGGFLMFIAISFIAQWITGTMIVGLIEKTPSLNWANATGAEAIAYTRENFMRFMVPILILTIAFSVASFFITNVLMLKKLDLE